MMKNYRLTKGLAILQSGPKTSSIIKYTPETPPYKGCVEAGAPPDMVPTKKRAFEEYPLTGTPKASELNGNKEGPISHRASRGKGQKGS